MRLMVMVARDKRRGVAAGSWGGGRCRGCIAFPPGGGGGSRMGQCKKGRNPVIINWDVACRT